MIPFDRTSLPVPAGLHRRGSSSPRRATVSVGENFRFGHRPPATPTCWAPSRLPRRASPELVEVDGEIVSSRTSAAWSLRRRRGGHRFLGPRLRCAGPSPRGQAGARARLPDGQPRPRPRARLPGPRRLRMPGAVELRRTALVAAVNVGVRPTFKTGRGLLVRPTCWTSRPTSTAASCGSRSSSACAASGASTASTRWSSRCTATWRGARSPHAALGRDPEPPIRCKVRRRCG